MSDTPWEVPYQKVCIDKATKREDQKDLALLVIEEEVKNQLYKQSGDKEKAGDLTRQILSGNWESLDEVEAQLNPVTKMYIDSYREVDERYTAEIEKNVGRTQRALVKCMTKKK